VTYDRPSSGAGFDPVLAGGRLLELEIAMKRWRWRENLKDMIESDRGEWVRFEDHAAEVHRLNNELTKLTLELAALKREKPRRCSGSACGEPVERAT
jgi:hypothetical protein